MTRVTNEQVLNAMIEESDAGDNITIKQYLKTLLKMVWEEQESFSGKRPFGNSGWSYELYIPLVKAKLIKGSLDEDGCLEDCDDVAADELITKAIESL